LLLAQTLNELPYVDSVMPVETNIVIFKVTVDYTAASIVNSLQNEGILCGTTGPDTIRFVTHLNISPDMIEKSLTILKGLNPVKNH
jgi:threonine aldolase